MTKPIDYRAVSAECWKDLPGFEDGYAVSTYGRVHSKEKKRKTGQGAFRVIPAKPIKAFVVRADDQVIATRVVLSRPGEGKRLFKVAALVLTTFVGPGETGQVPIFLDGDPSNNRLSNLRWGSLAESRKQNKRS